MAAACEALPISTRQAASLEKRSASGETLNVQRVRVIGIVFGLGLLGWGIAPALLARYEVQLLALPVASASEGEVLSTIIVHVEEKGSGVPCPRTSVSVLNVQTNQKYSVRSDAEGRAELDSLPAGEYELFVEIGTHFALYRGIRVGVEETAVVRARLRR